jgi:hypothetical protein
MRTNPLVGHELLTSPHAWLQCQLRPLGDRSGRRGGADLRAQSEAKPWRRSRQHAAGSTQQAARSTQPQHAARSRSTQQAARSTQYAVRSTRHAARSTQYAVRSTRHARAVRTTQLHHEGRSVSDEPTPACLVRRMEKPDVWTIA